MKNSYSDLFLIYIGFRVHDRIRLKGAAFVSENTAGTYMFLLTIVTSRGSNEFPNILYHNYE